MTPADSGGQIGQIGQALRELSPGYFAAVMATGICSIGLRDEGATALSRALLVLTAASFLGLIVLNGWRFARYRHEMAEDFTHPLRGFGFYTFVAAANVLAVRIAVEHRGVAIGLLAVASVAWLLRGYAVPWTTHLGAGEHPIVAAANGTWFMWAVGGQSISVAAATLAPYEHGQALPLIALIAWGLGLFLYVVDGVFVAMRLLAYDFGAADLTPPYWVAMGAAAITALAGSLVAHLPPGPFADVARDTIRAGSLLAWVIATWLVPALFAMGWWRHVTHRIPLRYDANLWSIVFPLGMYAMASTTIGKLDGLPWLADVGHVWTWVAFAAWLLTALAGVRHVVMDVLLG
ncbi:tellurite resistance/C4-dicarboxylate transporter family protein [Nocardioides terrisoli]|uniref:tellurite resistance/C4-dicarboxylate transporter family protein n=1 Tax=Nocardioides terrisoli TaxID=3388267 RepID=UPI00287B8987|nr:tellurite resistance/C4-dicarboxylate transporter family protein [Nocardioides marmorisolisilvae]